MIIKNVCFFGCGRVGLPLITYMDTKSSQRKLGIKFWGYDIRKDHVDSLNQGIYPYLENIDEGYRNNTVQEYFADGINGRTLKFTDNFNDIPECDVYIITVGTPLDEEGNARIDAVSEVIDKILEKGLNNRRMIILRSTVFPGTTRTIYNKILKYNEWDFDLIFCPERISQGNTFIEGTNPELVGCLEDFGYKRFVEFWIKFFGFNKKFIKLSWEEAELAKLMTNMYRYINLAMANEFYLISSQNKVDYEKIRNAVNLDYPRANLMKAGPNVGGPCLFKDGEFLLSKIPYVELIRTATAINESMVEKIWVLLYNNLKGNVKKVCILGKTFKANSDDIRNSLSFKLKKILEREGVEVIMFDPYIDTDWNKWVWSQKLDILPIDAFVLMTPHKEFDEHFYEKLPKNILMIDLWKHFEASKNTVDGISYT